MKKTTIRILSFIMVLALLLSVSPGMPSVRADDSKAGLEKGSQSLTELLEILPDDGLTSAATDSDYAEYNALFHESEKESSVKNEKGQSISSQLDYAAVDNVFASIDAMENAPAKKNVTRTQLTDAAIEIVKASDNYVEGSIDRNGNSFTWWTDEGIRCIYNPYMREKYANMEKPANAESAGIYNEPKTTKGGYPSGSQVYLIGPYYGIDDSFTNQYKNEANAIASAIGDTDGYTLYSGTSVTVDKVADAVENGAVVIFDSHGTTDYEGHYVRNDPDGYEVYDYVTYADYSYLCLTNQSGLTTADYSDGAAYFVDSDGYPCACINGEVIANHMDKNSPSGILWMAMCLGMATDTICAPMREKGVEVVYGYSQSVTFSGDYCFEETFWDNMIAGGDVATSMAAMKNKWGKWDWSTQIAEYYGYSGYATLANARKYYTAFPIVVSDEDAHPGQRYNSTTYGADSEQTVKSTYTIYNETEEPSVSDISTLQSAHPYANNTDYACDYFHPFAVDMLEITFSEDTKTESNYDFIYIYDHDGDLVGKYSGTQLAGKTVTIQGYHFTIRLTSDNRTTGYGFRVTSVVARNGETVQSPYTRLRNYINTYGGTFDDGTKVWLITNQSGNYQFYYSLHNEANGILFNYLCTTTTSSGFNILVSFLVQENSWYMDLDVIIEYYNYGYRYDHVDAPGYLDKTTITTETGINVTIPSPNIITGEDASELASSAFKGLCSVWDNNIYYQLGFGLNSLGFVSYYGNEENCYHSYSNSCDGICNACGEMRLIAHSFGDTTWQNDNLHKRVCSLCNVTEYEEHKWKSGAWITKPTAQNPGVLSYICSICGHSKTVTVNWMPGDIDENGQIDNKDVEYLLWHTLFPEDYPLVQAADFDADGFIDNKDVEYLLWHTLFPEDYPLH